MRRPAALLSIVVVFVCVVSLVVIATRDESAFRLREASAFDLVEQVRGFRRGQRGQCRDVPDANVATYPAFQSTQPVYGFVRFGSTAGRKDSGIRFCFAIDESAGTGAGYDRLYFDRNRDLDLTNDAVLRPLKVPPTGAQLPRIPSGRQVCFTSVGVPLAFSSKKSRPLPVLPRFVISEGGYKTIEFVTTAARRGRIKVAGQRFDVLLGHNYAAPGWFDQPETALHLIPRDKHAARLHWWGSDRLLAIHEIGGRLYRFSASPSGNRLAVRPYEGPLGTFAVGAGGRDIEHMEIHGSLLSEQAAVAVGRMSQRSGLVDAESCRVPVGDYLINHVRVTYGSLRISLSDNYHSDGQRLAIAKGRLRRFPVRIRADEPFVFDFANEPAVMFTSPARDQHVKRGGEVEVMAVLTDSVLDTMIRGLDLVEKRDKAPHEKTISLDPKVVVTRADGEVVAEGIMPFG